MLEPRPTDLLHCGHVSYSSWNERPHILEELEDFQFLDVFDVPPSSNATWEALHVEMVDPSDLRCQAGTFHFPKDLRLTYTPLTQAKDELTRVSRQRPGSNAPECLCYELQLVFSE